MFFRFEAVREGDTWVAGCSVDAPAGVIVTEARTKEELEERVEDAIRTFLSLSRAETVTFDIVYLS